jgi:LPXTG-site transpeptidase (sortase) family protein
MANHGKKNNKAANLIRVKLSSIYAEEPDAKAEVAEVQVIRPTSKHQKFMRDLLNSGVGIAEVQTAWHNYYIGLDNEDKKQVWDEFYASNKLLRKDLTSTQPEQDLAKIKNQVISKNTHQHKTKPPEERPTRVSQTIRDKVTANGKLKAKHHIQSLFFGLGMGVVVIFIFLFSFFNQVVIAPFIQPSRADTATPVIIGAQTVAATNTPQVIIPKINVQIPVDYSQTSIDENAIENGLEAGVVHYPTTVLPGENGNAAYFGHSSNNIFNPGKYKFAFVLLHTLVDGDTFYLTYNHTVYIYKVISSTIVSPNDVSVLGPVPGETATATLITCDPPGTSINRLIVVGQQISPDVSTNTSASSPPIVNLPVSLPGNGPSLWSRIITTKVVRIIICIVIVVGLIIFFRKLSKRLVSKG